jgi:phosphoglycerol geranylgeranyltransferase
MSVINLFNTPKKKLAILIDPDKASTSYLEEILSVLEKKKNENVFFFVGGSVIFDGNTEKTIQFLKERTKRKIILFPGTNTYISENADAFLLLSLISGRNPEWLISRHVATAVKLKNTDIEIISTSYLLIACGKPKSVHYISDTQAVPDDKSEIAVATAVAGEMIGHKLCYLEAGSGADYPVPAEMIKKVKQNINTPLIVGGGINNTQEAQEILDAGADILVVGNAFEEKVEFLSEIINLFK